MRFLIIGSEGFIGKHLTKGLGDLGHRVTRADIISCDDPGYFNTGGNLISLESVLQDQQFDVCINAAGNGNIGYSIQHPYEDFLLNCRDPFQLLDIIRKFQPSIHYVHLSSAAVYGNPQSLPITEQTPRAPISPYGWSKMLAEQVCEEFAVLYSIPISILRPFSVYGPGLRKQIMWDTYSKCSSASKGIELWGTGQETRDFIFVDDLVHAVNLVVQQVPEQVTVYNIASGIEKTIADVAGIFIKNFNPALTLTFNNVQRKGDPLFWKADISKISRLGFAPLTDLETGIAAYIKWVKEQDEA